MFLFLKAETIYNCDSDLKKYAQSPCTTKRPMLDKIHIQREELKWVSLRENRERLSADDEAIIYAQPHTLICYTLFITMKFMEDIIAKDFKTSRIQNTAFDRT